MYCCIIIESIHYVVLLHAVAEELKQARLHPVRATVRRPRTGSVIFGPFPSPSSSHCSICVNKDRAHEIEEMAYSGKCTGGHASRACAKTARVLSGLETNRRQSQVQTRAKGNVLIGGKKGTWSSNDRCSSGKLCSTALLKCASISLAYLELRQ